MDAPNIPYGYRAVTGQLQKGDGLWDGERFRKVKKGYPFLGTVEGVAIRRCEVTQEALPLEQPCQNPGCPNIITETGDEKCAACGHYIKTEETFEA